MMLYWFMWLLCLSATAEITGVYPQTKRILLECSTQGCLCNFDGFVGMYLYKDGKPVLYYNNEYDPDGQIVPLQERYNNQLQKKGYLQDNIIIISNVTVADSGKYSCVYVTFPRHDRDVVCNVHKIEINAELPESSEQKSAHSAECPSLFFIIILTSAVSVLFTMIFTLLMIPMVKRWAGRRRLTTRPESAVSNEYVYEVMTMNGFAPDVLRPSA